MSLAVAGVKRRCCEAWPLPCSGPSAAVTKQSSMSWSSSLRERRRKVRVDGDFRGEVFFFDAADLAGLPDAVSSVGT